MDFCGQVWKRVWEMAFFGLKLGGLDLEMRAVHPYQKFQGVLVNSWFIFRAEMIINSELFAQLEIYSNGLVLSTDMK